MARAPGLLALFAGLAACDGGTNPGQAITDAMEIEGGTKKGLGAFVQNPGPYGLQFVDVSYVPVDAEGSGNLALEFRAVWSGEPGQEEADAGTLQLHFDGADQIFHVNTPLEEGVDFEDADPRDGGNDTGAAARGAAPPPAAASYPPLPDGLVYYSSRMRMEWDDDVDFNVCGTVARSVSPWDLKGASNQKVVCYYCDPEDGRCVPEALHHINLDLYASSTYGYDYLRPYKVRVHPLPREGAPAPEHAPIGKYLVDSGYTLPLWIDPSIGYHTRLCDPVAATDDDSMTVAPGNPYANLFVSDADEIDLSNYNNLVRVHVFGASSRLQYVAELGVEGVTTDRSETASGPRDLAGPVAMTCEGATEYSAGTCPVLDDSVLIELGKGGCETHDLAWYLGVPDARWLLRWPLGDVCTLEFVATPTGPWRCPDCEYSFEESFAWTSMLEWSARGGGGDCGPFLGDFVASYGLYEEFASYHHRPAVDAYEVVDWSISLYNAGWAWRSTGGDEGYVVAAFANRYDPGTVADYTDTFLEGTWDPATRGFVASDPYGLSLNAWGTVP